MMTRILLQLLAVAFFAAQSSGADTHEFFYEVRVAKSLTLDASTAIELVTDQGSSGTRLKFMKQREEDGFNVYAQSTLLHRGQRRRALVVDLDNGTKPSQVFVLTIPRTPTPSDWSKWRSPDYIEKSDASWSFMHDLKKHDRSTNVPPDSLEIRYRITEWSMAPKPR
ncbi:MAG TPA: hypothetical protein VK530_04605 [Candidatus Acidoferrum sp.]|nr:hypothetical protein [Candidatus Acidoferrum sp.]